MLARSLLHKALLLCSIARGYDESEQYGAATPAGFNANGWVRLQSDMPPPENTFGDGSEPAAVRFYLLWQFNLPARIHSECVCCQASQLRRISVAVATHQTDSGSLLPPVSADGWLELWACGAPARGSAALGVQLWPAAVAVARWLAEPANQPSGMNV